MISNSKNIDKINSQTSNLHKRDYFMSLIDKASKENELSKEEIIELLQLEEKELLDYLHHKADSIRAQYHGQEVHLRGIIEFSNYCNKNCFYCGLRKDNQDLQRYKLNEEDIIEIAYAGIDLAYKTIVFQSGEDGYAADTIAYIIKKVKSKANIAISLCLGERDFQEYQLWKDAGADRYLLKHETADKSLYKKLHPEMDYHTRINHLHKLKEMGYQTGSGNIIGLPGQSLASLADDILLFKELRLDMAGIGPFIPHYKTPLAEERQGTVELTLKVLAITRLLIPLIHLPATTALGTVALDGRQRALQAGANIVMPNITSSKYRSLYEIYPAKICIDEKASDCRQCIGGIISSLGRTVSQARGDSLINK
ncbi:[FeFe] hydrogenase H-cluster radical SAM maturase HydE [Natronospora cellulosivora (SeqCode)]